MGNFFNMELTNIEEAILLGTLLGDGFLQKRAKKARLRICHSYKQKEYVDWKYNQLQRLCERTHPPKKENRQFGTTYSFATQTEKSFIKYHSLFYEKVSLIKPYRYRKKIDSQLLEYIKDPLSLAVWWLDDGSARLDSRSGRLATHSFCLDEQKILKHILFQNFQIHSQIVRYISKNKFYYFLSIPAKNKSFDQLIDLISIYVQQIPSMNYKLGKPRND